MGDGRSHRILLAECDGFMMKPLSLSTCKVDGKLVVEGKYLALRQFSRREPVRAEPSKLARFSRALLALAAILTANLWLRIVPGRSWR